LGLFLLGFYGIIVSEGGIQKLVFVFKPNAQLCSKAAIMRYMRKSELIISVMILLSFVIGIYLYFQMPDSMVSHWNAKGQADGYMSKIWGLFI